MKSTASTRPQKYGDDIAEGKINSDIEGWGGGEIYFFYLGGH
jgi:hypothetical protein